MNQSRLIFIALALTVAAGLGGLVFLSGQKPQVQPVVSTGTAQVGGAFTLTDQNGQTRNEALLKDKWTLVFFGFTGCPDVCPTNLTAMTRVQTILGDSGKDVQYLFVSIDPERDTPEALKLYLDNQAFPKGIIGLTGTPEQVKAIAKAYRIFYAKNGEGSDYLMDHTSATYLMDPDGKFERILPHGMAPDDVADQIRKAKKARS